MTKKEKLEFTRNCTMTKPADKKNLSQKYCHKKGKEKNKKVKKK